LGKIFSQLLKFLKIFCRDFKNKKAAPDVSRGGLLNAKEIFNDKAHYLNEEIRISRTSS